MMFTIILEAAIANVEVGVRALGQTFGRRAQQGVHPSMWTEELSEMRQADLQADLTTLDSLMHGFGTAKPRNPAADSRTPHAR